MDEMQNGGIELDFTDTLDGAPEEQVTPQTSTTDAEPQQTTGAESTNDAAPAPDTAAVDGWKLPVKFKGQQLELDREQAVLLAQKGMNYDALEQRLNEMQNAPEFRVLDEFAASAGMTRQEYLKYLGRQRQEQEIQNYLDRGLPHEFAKELMESKQNAQSLQEKYKALEEKVAQMEAREQQARIWSEFFTNHPDVADYNSLPDEVKRQIADGVPPETAYTRYENQQLKAKLQALEQKGKNQATAPGAIASEGAGEEEDAFSRAFLAALKE